MNWLSPLRRSAAAPTCIHACDRVDCLASRGSAWREDGLHPVLPAPGRACQRWLCCCRERRPQVRRLRRPRVLGLRLLGLHDLGFDRPRVVAPPHGLDGGSPHRAARRAPPFAWASSSLDEAGTNYSAEGSPRVDCILLAGSRHHCFPRPRSTSGACVIRPGATRRQGTYGLRDTDLSEVCSGAGPTACPVRVDVRLARTRTSCMTWRPCTWTCAPSTAW